MNSPISSTPRCPVCENERDLFLTLSLADLPVLCNALHDSRERALETPRGRIDLYFCPKCGHLFNASFDASRIDYNTTYENSLHHSPRFQEFARSLADRLIDTYGLRNRHIVEIGAGQGDFLDLLCERGNNTGIGFDPSALEESGESARYRIVREPYDEQQANHKAELVCCRHVLEHIEDPAAFMRTVRRSLDAQRETIVYIEVPHAGYMLERFAIWDVIYEHVSYFTPASISHLFRSAGFDIVGLYSEFDGQYLSVEAVSGPHQPASFDATASPELMERARDFAGHFSRKLHDWAGRLNELKTAEKKVVIWGAGSKGITFLNMLRDASPVSYAIDVNPRKQGKYIAGTGQRIESPGFLEQYRPDAIIAYW